MYFARPLFPALLALPVAAATGLVACSEKPATVAPSDTISAERFDVVEKELLALKAERESLLRGAAVSSSEALALASQLKELRTRLTELEARPVAAAPVPGDSTPPGGATGSYTPPPPVVGIPIPPDATTPFSEEQLTAFRRMADEVEKRKDAEQRAQRLKRDLATAGVSLTSDQEAALLKVQETYTERMRELYRSGGGSTDADRQAIVAKRDELRTQFANDVRNVVPASEADKIIEATGRMGGFRPRTDGASSGMMGGRGGMGG
jgi:hypothetical protein